MQFNKNEVKKLLKYICVSAIRFCTGVFNVFPIKNNRILFYSFNGKSFTCNPREVFNFLYHKNNEKYELIWSFKKPSDHITELPKGVKVVRFRSLKHYYYMKTSKIVVYNVHEEGEVARRKGQVFIQTWHASNGYKNLKSRESLLDQRINRLHHMNYSYVCSGCESMTKRRIRGDLLFNGDIIRGTPRMDQIFRCSHKKTHNTLCAELGIPSSTKLLLFAPTWRKERNTTDYGLNYKALRKCLYEQYGEEWYILVRFHPNVKVNSDLFLEKGVVDVTNYPEMQKLLCASDVMISDYSSCIWDYSFTYRPCFLYLPDLKPMCKDDVFEIPIEEWGFPVSYTMEELLIAIRTFDSAAYRIKIENHHKAMGSYEDGHATKRIADLISEIINCKI